MRIVSLLPSATEIVAALGFEAQLVGRSHECDFPPSVTRLPVCTEPKFNVEGPSSVIDQRVNAILSNALSIYRVDADLLKQLHPDVVVTQAHCEVCAVSMEDVERAMATWLGSRPKVVSLCPNSLQDIWADFALVADALEVRERGAQLVSRIRARMDDIAARARSLPRHPSVAYIEWIDPLMAGGNWMPELVAMAGGVNLFGETGAHSPRLEFADLAAADPEVILLSPCGFNISRTLQDLPALSRRSGWPALKAVRAGKVYVADGNQYFNRPGPRLSESLEILGEMLHPQAFDFGHQGHGWQTVGSA